MILFIFKCIFALLLITLLSFLGVLLLKALGVLNSIAQIVNKILNKEI